MNTFTAEINLKIGKKIYNQKIEVEDFSVFKEAIGDLYLKGKATLQSELFKKYQGRKDNMENLKKEEIVIVSPALYLSTYEKLGKERVRVNPFLSGAGGLTNDIVIVVNKDSLEAKLT